MSWDQAVVDKEKEDKSFSQSVTLVVMNKNSTFLYTCFVFKGNCCLFVEKNLSEEGVPVDFGRSGGQIKRHKNLKYKGRSKWGSDENLKTKNWCKKIQIEMQVTFQTEDTKVKHGSLLSQYWLITVTLLSHYCITVLVKVEVRENPQTLSF